MTNPISGISAVITDYCYLSDGDSNFDSVIKFFTNGVITSDSEWAFLPVQPEEDAFVFYAFFKSDKSLRFFNEVGKASLGGPFISQLRIGAGTVNHLNALVARMYSLGYFKFQEVRLDRNNEFVVERLSRLRSVIEKSVDALQPTGVLALSDIRKFRQHLVNGEFQSAQDVLNQIGATGRLSSVNFLFLELQLMQKMGRDQEIWSHPSINEFVVTARPRVVTEFLLESLWNYLLASLTTGEIESISDLHIQRMRKLLGGIKTPQSRSGRICLAIVLAVSAIDDSLNNYDIPDDEISDLQAIIARKMIPDSLLPSSAVISPDASIYDFSDLGQEEFHAVRQELVDVGDARGLFALLGRARSLKIDPESTLKNIVNVVESEFLVDLATDAVGAVIENAAQTSNWTINLQKKWDKIRLMSSFFEGGFASVGDHLDSFSTGSDLAFRVRVLEECFQSWPIEYFENDDVDREFGDLIKVAGTNAILESALNDLAVRLQENGMGSQTLGVIQGLLG
jgi:hypothetical protein